MKYIIKIVDNYWAESSNTKMIYKDGKGRLFLGPLISGSHGKKVILEASDAPLEDGYYHIIKIIGVVGEGKGK